jgi:anti-sigma B factor antagonist
VGAAALGRPAERSSACLPRRRQGAPSASVVNPADWTNEGRPPSDHAPLRSRTAGGRCPYKTQNSVLASVVAELQARLLPRFNTIFTFQYYDVRMPQESLNIEDVSGLPDGQRVLRLTGPVTIANFFQFQSLVRGNTSRHLILDMTDVPYMDSAGIGALVGAYVNHQKEGRSLALVGVTDRVRGALQVTRVEQFFKFYPNQAAAQDALK